PAAHLADQRGLPRAVRADHPHDGAPGEECLGPPRAPQRMPDPGAEVAGPEEDGEGGSMPEMGAQPGCQRAAEQEATDPGCIRPYGISELLEEREVDGRKGLAQQSRDLLLADPFAQPPELLRVPLPLPGSERFAQHRVVEGLADDEQHELGAAGGEVDPVFRPPCSLEQHALHRQMVVLDRGPGDGPVVDVEVDELAALFVQAVVVGDRRMAAAPGGPETRELYDRAEPGRVASMNQEVQVG